MNNSSAKRLFAVIGPPRCGTSALTRGLKVLGIDLGTALRAAKKGVNDEGFWEDLDIAALNVKIYKALEHEWHKITDIESDRLEALVRSELRPQAVQLLDKKLRDQALFGFKDLHITRILPFWMTVFSELGVRCDFLISCRDPRSMAQSLAKLAGFDLQKCYFLWNEFVIASLTRTQGHTVVVVQYDRLLEQPEAELRRVATKLDLHFDASSEAFVFYRDEFLNAGLRSSAGSRNIGDEGIPFDSAELYALLKDLATDRCVIGSDEFNSRFDAIRQRHENVLSLLQSSEGEQTRMLDVIRGDLAASRALLEIAGESAQSGSTHEQVLEDAIHERDRLLERASQGLVERTLELMTTRETLEERTAALEEATRRLDEHVRELARVRGALDIHVQSEQVSSRDLVARTDELVTTRALLVERTNALQELSDTLHERTARLDGMHMLLEQHVAALGHANEALGERDRLIAELHLRYGEAVAAAESLRQVIEAANTKRASSAN